MPTPTFQYTQKHNNLHTINSQHDYDRVLLSTSPKTLICTIFCESLPNYFSKVSAKYSNHQNSSKNVIFVGANVNILPGLVEALGVEVDGGLPEVHFLRERKFAGKVRIEGEGHLEEIIEGFLGDENFENDLENNNDIGRFGLKSCWYLFRTAKSMFSNIFGSKIELVPLSNRKIDVSDEFRVKNRLRSSFEPQNRDFRQFFTHIYQ